MGTLARYPDFDMMPRIAKLQPQTQTEAEALGAAIRACRKDRLTQVELCARTGIAQSTLSGWENGSYAPTTLQLLSMEEACERPRGWISIRAGLVAEVTSVPEAIAVAPELDDGQRRIIMDVYRGFAKPQ